MNEGMDLGQPAANLLELASLVVREVSVNRDLSLTAVSALGSLDWMGPRRITALAAAESVSQPSMTQLIQRLEQRGLVARSSDPADGRAALVSLTDEGREALAERRARAAQRIALLLTGLPAADVRALDEALTAVLPAMRSRAGADTRISSAAAGGRQ
jgi:DNA-binding MarR family transcriptional regulator